MRSKSVSKTITRHPNWLRHAIPPGEILLEEYLKPLGLGQLEAAKRLGISLNRLNEIVLGKAWHYGGYGASACTVAEDIAATVDAAADVPNRRIGG